MSSSGVALPASPSNDINKSVLAAITIAPGLGVMLTPNPAISSVATGEAPAYPIRSSPSPREICSMASTPSPMSTDPSSSVSLPVPP